MNTPTASTRTRLVRVVMILLLAAGVVGAWFAWTQLQPPGLPEGIASGNGRLEATDLDVATRSGGRLQEVRVQEGDFVEAGQVLATMDTLTLQADLNRAAAQVT